MIKGKMHFLYRKKSLWTGIFKRFVACDNLIQGPLKGTFKRTKVTCNRCKRTKRFRRITDG